MILTKSHLTKIPILVAKKLRPRETEESVHGHTVAILRLNLKSSYFKSSISKRPYQESWTLLWPAIYIFSHFSLDIWHWVPSLGARRGGEINELMYNKKYFETRFSLSIVRRAKSLPRPARRAMDCGFWEIWIQGFYWTRTWVKREKQLKWKALNESGPLRESIYFPW